MEKATMVKHRSTIHIVCRYQVHLVAGRLVAPFATLGLELVFGHGGQVLQCQAGGSGRRVVVPRLKGGAATATETSTGHDCRVV